MSWEIMLFIRATKAALFTRHLPKKNKIYYGKVTIDNL